MKIIFLDIDGVLNGYNYLNLIGWKFFKTLHLKGLYRKITNPFGIHESKVKKLAKIVHKTNAKVVMSSSWRNQYWNTPYEDKSKEQKILYDLLNKYNIEVIDITPTLIRQKRCDEILAWLSRNEEKVEKFIILDDEPSHLQCFLDNELIQTSSIKPSQIIMGHYNEDTGLKRKHIKKAIEKLS